MNIDLHITIFGGGGLHCDTYPEFTVQVVNVDLHIFGVFCFNNGQFSDSQFQLKKDKGVLHCDIYPEFTVANCEF